MRDGLSISELPTPIWKPMARAAGGFRPIRSAMLGLSDRSAIAQLMATVLGGDAARDRSCALHCRWNRPVAMVRGLMDLTTR